MSLPSGYKQLEYIQSSGTQYIDTGFKPKHTTRVVMDLQLLSTASVPYVFGTWAGGMNNCFSVYWWTDVHNSWGVDYGTQRSAIPQTNWNKRLTVDLNQNVVTVDSVSYTLTATTFTATNNLFLLALNNGNSALDYTVAKVYGCKIYDNGTLVRDFIPCKNASGVIGLWDDVSSTFYQNSGSGTFTSGTERKGTNKTLIGGTGYDLKGGKTLIGGTAYAVKKGRMLKDGTGYDISLASGVPLSELTPGTILYINESGSPVPFYVAKHDYESGLNGAGRTLVVRKDCYGMLMFGAYTNSYASSNVDSWNNNTYLKLLSVETQKAIGTTKIYYTEHYDKPVTILERAVFQLSATELGGSDNEINVEGTTLPISNILKKAYRNGTAVTQWTRTPYLRYTSYMCYFDEYGNLELRGDVYNDSYGSRPDFTLPATMEVQDNGDGTYSLVE